MEEELLKLLQKMKQSKLNARVEPSYVLRIDLNKEINKSLNKLYSDGRISVGETLNDKWIDII